MLRPRPFQRLLTIFFIVVGAMFIVYGPEEGRGYVVLGYCVFGLGLINQIVTSSEDS